MKAQIYDLTGKQKGSIDLPKEFSVKIREDIVGKVLEAKKRKQPYSPSPVGGKQHSASGIIKHRRHVWKTHYGQGISRIPRKIISRRGNRFNWIGAEISSATGGRRAHPPKILSALGLKKINKKEMEIAFKSALSATADKNYLSKKYSRIEKIDKEIPFIISYSKNKTKNILSGLKTLLGDLYDVAIKKKSVRAGKGKLRGRKYKSNAGMLLVLGKKEELKTKMFDIVHADKLGVNDLAKGGLGRLTIYTEQAIKEIEEKFKCETKEKKENKK